VKKTVSASPEHNGEPKKPSTLSQPKPPQPKSPQPKVAAKKESPKKTTKVEQPKKAEVEVAKPEKKESQQKRKELKPADFDEGTHSHSFTALVWLLTSFKLRRLGASCKQKGQEEEANW
jgi:outer membrane biosynthesis protein TonB